jgi:hypothetical protein
MNYLQESHASNEYKVDVIGDTTSQKGLIISITAYW